MEPIPESSEAVDEYGPFEPDLLENLRDRASQVRDLVPDCVGLSLASREHGVSFTVVATDEEIAALDGAQYLGSGPCVASVEAAQVLEYTDESPLEESSWQMFAMATAAAGIRSTLTLPLVAETEGEVLGSVNLYAAAPHSFDGHHEAIAHIFGAWAPGAVANADLGFSTRRTAEQAPELLYAEIRVEVAVGLLVEAEGISVTAAREQLRQAARRAGVDELTLAQRVIAGVAYAEGDREE